MFVYLISAIVGRSRLFDLGEEFGKIVQLEGSFMLLEESYHLARDVPLIETVPCRHDTGSPALRRCSAFGFDHERERMRERREFDGVSRLVPRAVRLQPITLIVGPVLEKFKIALNGGHGSRSQREPVAGVFDGPCRYLFETHRAPAFQDSQCGVNRSWDNCGIETCAIKRLVPRRVVVNCGAFRGPTLSHDRHDFTRAFGINKHEAFAAEAVKVLLNDTPD